MKLDQIFDVEQWKKNLSAEIVYEDNNGFFITINSLSNPTYLALWKDGEPIGTMYLKNVKHNKEDWTHVDSVQVRKEFRNRGLAKLMYKTALKLIKTKGLISYLPNRENQREIPRIYRSLGGFEEDDYAFIPKR